MRLREWLVNQSSDPDNVAQVFALVAAIHWGFVVLFWSILSYVGGFSLSKIPSPLPDATTAVKAGFGILGFGVAVSAAARLQWRARLDNRPNPTRGLLGGVIIWATATVLWTVLIRGIPFFLSRVTASSVDAWKAVRDASYWIGLALVDQIFISLGTGLVVLGLVGFMFERIRLVEIT